MLKKGIVLGGAAVVLLGLVFGRSHVLTTCGLIRESVKDSVPLDYELKRARTMVKELGPDIRRNMEKIARAEADIAKLHNQISSKQERLAKSQRDILRLKSDLEEGGSNFVYSGESYSESEVRKDLKHRFDRFKTQQATVDNLKQVLHAREAGLAAAQEKLKEMLDAQEQLLVEIENQKARLEMVQVAQTSSEFNFDDSQLSRTRDLLEDITTRIDVQERLVDADTEFKNEIKLEDAEADRSLTEEITEFFGGKSDDRLAISVD